MKTESSHSRVLFLNRSYWPDAEATGQLLTDLCEDLTELEFQVVVLAGQPNQNPLQENFCRSGQERHNGVTIERVQHPQFNKRHLLGRAINLIGFLIAAAWRSFRVSRPDVVIVETDPFLLPLLARRLKKWHKCRMIVYLQDIYPDIAVVLGKIREGWLVRFLRSQLRAAYHDADRIVVLSGDMKNRLMRWGVDGTKIHCIENWVDTCSVIPVKEFNPLRDDNGRPNRFVVMHSGNMGLSQHLDNVVESSALIQDRDEIEVLFVGGGADRINLETQSKRLKLTNLKFLPYQPRDQLAQSLSAADVHLISMHPEAHHCLMPSKLYGIIASGTAVIAITAADSELARIIRDERIGFVVPPRDPRSLATQIRWCADHRDELRVIGQRARTLAVERFDRKHQTKRFGDLVSNVCSTKTN